MEEIDGIFHHSGLFCSYFDDFLHSGLLKQFCSNTPDVYSNVITVPVILICAKQ